MTERRKSRRAFIADLLFLGGGVTAVALVGTFRGPVDGPERLPPASDAADSQTQPRPLPPSTPATDGELESGKYKIIRLARPTEKLPKSPYPGDCGGIPGLLDR